MSASVTPARRRRRIDDIDGEGDWESAANITGSRASRSKRARHDSESNDEDEDANDGPLLPDDFRRSPQNRRQHDTLQNSVSNDGPARYQPGSIVRVALKNFVTYTSAEFIPGPHLNMVIGPNGTGKSTLVCAICIGLGWETAHLGRAKELGEFVKHGERQAMIEIELARDEARQRQNPVITTKISKEGNKIQFAVNGDKANKKAVRDLARSFSIQVDNLCQFLPQDRVVEFANLSAERLLEETQRAAAPDYMIEWHSQLKAMRKEQLNMTSAQQEATETLSSMEVRQNAQTVDYERQRERGDVHSRKEAFEKLRPIAVYTARKKEHNQAKVERKEAEKELRTLERSTAPQLLELQQKKQYADSIGKVRDRRKRLAERAEQNAGQIKARHDGVDDKITEAHNDIEAERNAVRATKQSIPALQQTLRQIKTLIDQGGPADFDPAAYNEKLRNYRRDLQDKEGEKQAIETQMQTMAMQVRQKNAVVQQLLKEKEDLKSQAGQQVSKLRSASRNGDAAKAWDWIQNNRNRFNGEVYGPPIVECSVKNPRFASAVESALNQGEMTAFTVTSGEDFNMLQEQLYGSMKLSDVNIRSSVTPLADFTHPCSKESLLSFGLECWVLDLIEGPESVLAMLCENRNIHRMAFTSTDISNQQYEALSRSPISNFVTSKQIYQRTSRVEYGPDATSTRVNPLKPARFFTNTAVDRGLEQQLDERIREHKGDVELIMLEQQQCKTSSAALTQDIEHLNEERDRVQIEKNTKQRGLAHFQALPTKLEMAEGKLREAQQRITESRERQIAILERAEKLSIEKGQAAIDYANSLSSIQQLMVQSIEATIVSIEAASDVEQLEARQMDTLTVLEAKRAQVQQLRQRTDELRAVAQAIGDECRKINDSGGLSELEEEVHQLLIGDQDDAENGAPWGVEQVDAEIESLTSRLEMTLAGGGSRNVIQEYETRAQKIEEKRQEVASLEAQVAAIDAKIRKVRQQWEPQLDALTAQISEAFTENFARIQCSGEVVVWKEEADFEKWAIHIMVKFRESDPLTRLSAQRQSGGERAVSTIFYLMALQSLARAPFRVVDEINQGMDPRNERLVHSRMVEIACGGAETGSSQYFLITPKLLHGLRYHPRMRVLSIFSGDFVPGAKAEKDFEALARRAVQIKKGVGFGTAAA
ncbi:putative ABC/SMC5 protein [Polychaeton citri CBS 116435]|uniref:Structural maintenance of chromosomes protein 5 n=1 Tax=Polychaeton citri CBS 116435 TaxID=1314669 RepID=A0A9P4UQW0_9PEZI|nr:putative ABC/SMC5 protein [Polychaeton citri CBS 116435]